MQLLKPMKEVINYLQQTKTVTIHKNFEVYDVLFDHLESQASKAQKINKNL